MNPPIFKLIRYGIQCTIFVVLIGCQSTLTNTGIEHRKATEKWHELAHYADSELRRYGITISAELVTKKQGDIADFSLANIRLNHTEQLNEINLLSPEFLVKYACNIDCQRINLYIPDTFHTGQTLLIRYFSDYEFELFDFYAKLMLLNKQLKKLENNNPQLLNTYLQSLVAEQQSFNRLDDFAKYLHDRLMLSSMQDFVIKTKNPAYKIDRPLQSAPDSKWEDEGPLVDGISAGTLIAPDEYWLSDTLLPNENWDDDTPLANIGWNIDVSLPEKDWQSNADSPDLLWNVNPLKEHENWATSTLMADENWLVNSVMPNDSWHLLKPTVDEQLLASAELQYRLSRQYSRAWTVARRVYYSIGDTVCSFNDNYFGIVKGMSDDQVTVAVLGQAKSSQDGLALDVADGSLFDENTDVYFDSLKFDQQFSRQNIARCQIEVM
ncbi:hypothetical protein [Neptunicella sp.]|uniref:hypothetical protein n=1 Tax=Neptunicella sp. TaxID=2125986 RepID=UPI003F692885